VRLIRRYYFFFLIISILLLWPNKSFAFFDNFTVNPLVNPDWDIENPAGLVHTNPGMSLESVQGNRFPYLHLSTDVSLEQDNAYEVIFRYVEDNPTFGAGFSLTDNVPNLGQNMIFPDAFSDYSIFYVWGAKLHIATSLCPAEAPQCTEKILFLYPNANPSATYDPNTPSDLDLHIFRVEKKTESEAVFTYKIFLDGSLIFRSAPTGRVIKSIWIGHPQTTSTLSGWPKLDVYRFSSELLSSFPFYSQLDYPGIEYDHASKWSEPEKTGIDRWGCALTSAAMILTHYDVKSVLGEETTPVVLNEWLRTQGDGFIRNGLVNWLAVARYAKHSFDAGKAPKALEYTRASYVPAMTLELPSILGEPGHFLVAYEAGEDTYFVNDPRDGAGLMRSKEDVFTTVNQYSPSETDLSYLMIVANEGAKVALLDSDGKEVGEPWVEDPPKDGVDQIAGNGNRLLIHLYPKPETGRYYLSSDVDLTEIYWYDASGEYGLEELVGSTQGKGFYLLDYHKDDATLGGVTSESFADLVWRLYGEKQIKHRQVARALIKYYKTVERMPERAIRMKKYFINGIARNVKLYTRYNMITELGKTQLLVYLD